MFGVVFAFYRRYLSTSKQKMNTIKTITISFILALLTIYGVTSAINDNHKNILGKGDVSTLSVSYQRWEKQYLSQGGKDFLVIPLKSENNFGLGIKQNQSQIKINIHTGQLDAEIFGIPTNQQYRLLLQAERKHSPSIHPDFLEIGDLQAYKQGLHLVTQLDISSLQDVFLNQAVVVSDTGDRMMSGQPSLFQKLFYDDQFKLSATDSILQQTAQSFNLIKTAYAAKGKLSLKNVLTEQIARGRDLFINETFGGNGRTCATCHRLDNNHTIDPKYIATLPDNDPLFVAEFMPELAELEQPDLLRQFGLIIANVDGFDKAGVLRSVPHLFALGTSITPEQEFEGKFVTHALGWSADGSVGDGSLRMFTIGAVKQHMPKTMNRQPGVDFRMPTDDELDALEAYMLSLGRTEDPDLDSMNFSSPLVQKGRELFHSKQPGTGQCKGCHFNGGANSSTSLQNGNRDTGVDNMPDNPLKLVWKKTPDDGGFGTEVQNDCGWFKNGQCFGNREFNMTTVIEAADTAPFFHNNSVNTIEEAIAFYNSNAFHQSPGANPADPEDPDSVCERCIHLEPSQITSVALFLRTLNAMENIRSSNALDEQAMLLKRKHRIEIIKLAIAETKDAIEVLQGGQVIANPESLKKLTLALKYEKKALRKKRSKRWIKFLKKAVYFKQQANDLFLQPS